MDTKTMDTDTLLWIQGGLSGWKNMHRHWWVIFC